MPPSNEDQYNAQFQGFHTPEASPNASPDPDTKDFRKGKSTSFFIFLS
jgi:hypothetical protein